MDEAALILSFDTATPGGSICLSRGDVVLAALVGDARASHSNSLLCEIDDLLTQCEVSLAAVELFAVALGPGSFTGLRIGLASAKAFAATLNRPCVGIPTLHAVAHSAGPSKATVTLLPAGRGEVFTQLFAVSSSGVPSELDRAAHLPPSAMLAQYGMMHNLVWAGAGAWAQRDNIQAYAASNGIAFSDRPAGGDEIRPSGWVLAAGEKVSLSGEQNLATDIAALAWQRFQSGRLENADSLQAIYVRPADAEMKMM